MPSGNPDVSYAVGYEETYHEKTLQTFISQAFAMEFANLFKDFTLEQLDEAAKSFRFERCFQKEGWNKIMSEHAKLSKNTPAVEPGESAAVVGRLGNLDKAIEALPWNMCHAYTEDSETIVGNDGKIWIIIWK